jgi:hypothetical protein
MAQHYARIAEIIANLRDSSGNQTLPMGAPEHEVTGSNPVGRTASNRGNTRVSRVTREALLFWVYMFLCMFGREIWGVSVRQEASNTLSGDLVLSGVRWADPTNTTGQGHDSAQNAYYAGSRGTFPGRVKLNSTGRKVVTRVRAAYYVATEGCSCARLPYYDSFNG